MYQKAAIHPLSEDLSPISNDVFDLLWEIFSQIGKFWQDMDDPSPYRIQVYNFVLNRMNLRPIYHDYYTSAPAVIKQLKDQLGQDKAYEFLFTDQASNVSPPQTPVAVVRQHIVNEFIAFQLALGGFKAFGAVNYCGYFGGANIPGKQVPYRTFEIAQ